MVKNIFRYLNIFKTLFKYNLAREMEYRANFITKNIVSIGWVFVQVIVIEVIFQFTNSVAGWSKGELFIFLGMLRIIKALFDGLFRPNIFAIPKSIGDGTLDLVLTKPLDSLFLISIKQQVVYEVSEIIIGTIFILYGFSITGETLTILNALQIVIFSFFGLAAYYSLFTIFSLLAFFSTRLSSVTDFNEVVNQGLKFPTNIYTTIIPGIIVLVFPLLFVSTLPASIILGKVSPIFVLIQLTFPIIMLFLIHFLWNKCLLRYSSASS